MSSMPKCQALHIVRSCLWYFYLNKVIFPVSDVSSQPLLLWKFFFTLIFAVLLVGTNFYTRHEYLTYLRFKFQLPTSDSTQINAVLHCHQQANCMEQSQKLREQAYISLIRSRLEYCAAVWDPLLRTSTPSKASSDVLPDLLPRITVVSLVYLHY